MSIFATFYQISIAYASLEITDWIRKNNYHANYGAVYAHVGNLPNHMPNSNISVVEGLESVTNKQQIIYHKSIEFIGFKIKDYYVVQKDELK